jgi:purine-nucleoside phosphorylase
MNSLLEKVRTSAEFVRARLPSSPSTAIVLGSGLSDLFDSLPVIQSLTTASIPHYPLGSVEGHKGMLLLVKLGGESLLVFEGRTHFYEHRDTDAVLYPVHLMNSLGVRTLLVTNAAGGVNRAFKAGDIMIITDHINLTGISLAYEGFDSFKVKTPLYSRRMVDRACAVASQLGLDVKTGVYAGVKGPSYETGAEVEMIRRVGGDAVGMSTVLEVGLASSLGIEVLGVSCITNLATGISSNKLSHQEVTEVANKVRKDLALFLASTIAQFLADPPSA